VDVLNDGKSDLSIIDSMGKDMSVVRAARVSYAGDDQEWRGEKDEKLIRYMANHGHGTPFEHTSITFHVACPLFVRGQWHRHRIGWSYNEISRRYTSDDIDFYFPSTNDWRIQDTKNKQSSEYELARYDHDAADELTFDAINLVWKQNYAFYLKALNAGVGREQARMFLTQNTYTRFYATCNLRSAAHFINLRADPHAQWEIRQYAQSMYDQLKELYPVSIKALCDLEPEPQPKPWYIRLVRKLWG
jgi:thymidylate synthase (FAD)